jgi:hypothetical protein
MPTRSEHDITAAIEGATQRIRAYRLARRMYVNLLEMEGLSMTFLRPPNNEVEVIKPDQVGALEHDLTVLKQAAPAKPAVPPPAKVQIRGMSSIASTIRSRLESVRTNMSGLTDDLSSLDKTLADMRGHVTATHDDIHSDATMLGRAADACGLAKLLMDKGVFTEAEYIEYMRLAANEELARYTDHCRREYGLSENVSFG